MASGMYEYGVAEIMRGNVDLINDSITALLVDPGFYTPDLSLDTSQDDIPEAARISEVELTGNTLDGTTFRADDVTFNSVPTTVSEASAVVVFFNSGVYNTSTLIAYIDNAPEFPITPDGGDIVIAWDTGSDGIFTL